MRSLNVRAALALLAAAATAGTPVTAGSRTPTLDGTAWILSSLTDRPLIGRQPVTLRFEDGRAAGSDGCNRYLSPVTVQGNSLSIPPTGASTMMACEPAVMEQARAYSAALAATSSYRIVDGELELLDAGGRILATFAPQPQSLAGTSWRATGINNGRGAVASIVQGTVVTLAFDGAGRASGSTGCNSFNARYESSGPRLKFTAPGSTRRMCGGEGVMQQEAAFLAALQTVDTMRMEGNRLELRRADGALAVSLTLQGGE